MPFRVTKALAALAIGLGTLALYRSTLLPDVELGDTPSFQTMVGRIDITPRDGYPLYYAIGSLFVRFGGTRAHALNLASAVEAAAACSVIVLVAAELTATIPAAVAAALIFAGSYTFWSQAVIAEVYALHILFVALTMLLLLRWSRRPTTGRLALFFAAYALGFGNHLTMILLAPAFALFILISAPEGWRSIVAWRIAALGIGFAALGALQYAWNFQGLWASPTPPRGWLDALQTFWFDVTKSDWRDTMVLRVPAVMAGERLQMYLFDVLQQVGWVGLLLSAAGAVWLFRTDWRRGLLVAGVYLATIAFALGYNVGDVHVFFLPATLMLALLAGYGIVGISVVGAELPPTLARMSSELRRDLAVAQGAKAGVSALRGAEASSAPTSLVAFVVIALFAARIYHDYPAVDRSRDTRPADLLHAMTRGLDDRNAILITDLNWQVQNGLTYFGNEIRPELAYTRLADVMLYAPALIRDNLAIGRDVALTERARQQLDAAYGPLFRTAPDRRFPRVTLDELTRDLSAGTRYVVCVLKPTREFPIAESDVALALRRLTSRDDISIPLDRYAIVGGIAGQPPAILRSSVRPFTVRTRLDGVAVEVRMESWLEFDTIRRMGFGHVIANRNHALIVERGISFITIDQDGTPLRSGYAAGIFAHEGRHLIRK